MLIMCTLPTYQHSNVSIKNTFFKKKDAFLLFLCLYKLILKTMRNYIKIFTAFLLSIFLSISINGYSLDLDIRIFSDYKIPTFTFTAISGKYLLIANDETVLEIYKNNPLVIAQKGEKITISRNNQLIGEFSEIVIQKAGLVNAFKINTNIKGATERIYDDELHVHVQNDELYLINRVELERYIAGVVQSEIFGSSEDVDFFKIQAIIARTYAITNLMKHMPEGYNLCDGVHCQTYKRRCNHSNIMMAVSHTFCDVVVDKEDKLISAAFFSNSGGQTENSEDVWVIPTSYLKSKVDTFSLDMRNSVWEKKILKNEWIGYFTKNYPWVKSIPDYEKKLITFEQPNRKRYIMDSIRVTHIRRDFNLKSTFFSISQEGEYVVLKGKGYGHGVGLSQEGAIKMIRLGYNFEDVIKFYYTDVKIVKYTDIIKY